MLRRAGIMGRGNYWARGLPGVAGLLGGHRTPLALKRTLEIYGGCLRSAGHSQEMGIWSWETLTTLTSRDVELSLTPASLMLIILPAPG